MQSGGLEHAWEEGVKQKKCAKKKYGDSQLGTFKTVKKKVHVATAW